ncbi:Asp-tRNA(Asn)/Glu-tRNA(Gln) amidotransferase subunit GatC [Bdellovibrio bacteriovorus]|uniref:Aspartyl/glutamyl-tRNA(Asn/Gln) amidotransferase subunit C n=1 Tax=Bdellovibrio bacteriovorus str. Tiberius TaxID=1069642 RepID=K7YQD9_BDEBC|nr:Asp-tRNA(Asn)/Glu-tRNA(Gln) amidotransferase subunit GatC [Bdellovibrio bacteriovorus]AFX99767.1 glutamyl-tRNA(Gln) amidotransferase (subunit C) [Bdellovibrio bacteriovorus str. Tiberius]
MIDKKTIEAIAKLARLHVSDEEAQEYSTQLAKALTHFEQISKINTAGIEPLVTPTEVESYWREDVVSQEFTADEMTGNAPDRAGNLFKVPPVV